MKRENLAYKVIGEFKTRDVRGCVFKVYDDKLLVFICGEDERRFTTWFETE